MTHHPLIIGQLNDGQESKYPGSDVAELDYYTQLQIDVELTNSLDETLLDHVTFQGEAGTNDFDKGIAIMPGLMFVSNAFWVPMNNKNNALVVRTRFKGTALSLIAAHRPIEAMAENRVDFDNSLLALWKKEKQAGSIPMVGIDTNDPNPLKLVTALNAKWIRPFSVSICGFLLPQNVDVYGCVSLPKTGEHPPVIALTKVPII